MDLTDSKNEVPKMIMFSSLVGNRNIKVKHVAVPQQFEVDIAVKIRGSVLEYTGDLSIDTVEGEVQLEKRINQKLKYNILTLVKRMQENNVDSLGLGRYVRNSLSYEEWKKLNWRKVYPNIAVNCTVDTKIKDYGMFR